MLQLLSFHPAHFSCDATNQHKWGTKVGGMDIKNIYIYYIYMHTYIHTHTHTRARARTHTHTHVGSSHLSVYINRFPIVRLTLSAIKKYYTAHMSINKGLALQLGHPKLAKIGRCAGTTKGWHSGEPEQKRDAGRCCCIQEKYTHTDTQTHKHARAHTYVHTYKHIYMCTHTHHSYI